MAQEEACGAFGFALDQRKIVSVAGERINLFAASVPRALNGERGHRVSEAPLNISVVDRNDL